MTRSSDDPAVYERISLMRLQAGARERALWLLGELLELYAAQAGYIEAYTLVSPENASGSNVCGITLWRDRACADAAAATSEACNLRAELGHCLVNGSDIERGFAAKHEPSAAGFRWPPTGSKAL
jgi:hypothetical protein